MERGKSDVIEKLGIVKEVDFSKGTDEEKMVNFLDVNFRLNKIILQPKGDAKFFYYSHIYEVFNRMEQYFNEHTQDGVLKFIEQAIRILKESPIYVAEYDKELKTYKEFLGDYGNIDKYMESNAKDKKPPTQQFIQSVNFLRSELTEEGAFFHPTKKHMYMVKREIRTDPKYIAELHKNESDLLYPHQRYEEGKLNYSYISVLSIKVYEGEEREVILRNILCRTTYYTDSDKKVYAHIIAFKSEKEKEGDGYENKLIMKSFPIANEALFGLSNLMLYYLIQWEHDDQSFISNIDVYKTPLDLLEEVTPSAGSKNKNVKELEYLAKLRNGHNITLDLNLNTLEGDDVPPLSTPAEHLDRTDSRVLSELNPLGNSSIAG